MQSLRDNPDYVEWFEIDVISELYEKILIDIDDKDSGEEIIHQIIETLNSYSFLYVNTLPLINDFIKFLYLKKWPIKDDELFKSILKKYLEEQTNNFFVPRDTCTNEDYIFYRKNKINMEGFYYTYHCRNTLDAIKRSFENDDVKSVIEIKWSSEFREAESIVFNNKTYKFSLFYEKKDIEGELHFWRLNEENKWERLSFVNSYSYEPEICYPEFVGRHFYVWTADNPGNDSIGTLEYYCLV